MNEPDDPQGDYEQHEMAACGSIDHLRGHSQPEQDRHSLLAWQLACRASLRRSRERRSENPPKPKRQGLSRRSKP